MAVVLVIDDDSTICKLLGRQIEGMGHEATCLQTIREGIGEAKRMRFDAVLLDVNLPDGNGLDILSELKETPSHPEVIIMTGDGDPDGAEIAIKNGAWDYIQKPFRQKDIQLMLTRILRYREELTHREPSSFALKAEGIRGESRAMRTCLDLLAQAAGSDTSILLNGETGVGKELFARAIHENSGRRNKPFVIVDCAVLPENLTESALFGHERGSFTGAVKTQVGLIKQADGGTLFLDEIGELSASTQKVFLRALQERKFRSIGGEKEIVSDFRLVAATNRDLDRMAEAGTFRSDLLFRVKAMTIELPPLRNRSEDIPSIVLHHVAQFCERRKMEIKGIAPEFFEALKAYQWPGNVRELVNTIETAIGAAGRDQVLTTVHLPMQIRVLLARQSAARPASQEGRPSPSGPSPASRDAFVPYRDRMRMTEKQYLLDLMALSKGNINEAIELSGLSRSRLYALLKEHDISRQS